MTFNFVCRINSKLNIKRGYKNDVFQYFFHSSIIRYFKNCILSQRFCEKKKLTRYLQSNSITPSHIVR